MFCRVRILSIILGTQSTRRYLVLVLGIPHQMHRYNITSTPIFKNYSTKLYHCWRSFKHLLSHYICDTKTKTKSKQPSWWHHTSVVTGRLVAHSFRVPVSISISLTEERTKERFITYVFLFSTSLVSVFPVIFHNRLLYAGNEVWFHMFTRTLQSRQHTPSPHTHRTTNAPLAPVLVLLITQLLHPNLHPILCPDHIFLLHFRACLASHLLCDRPGHIPDHRQDGGHGEEDHEGDQTVVRHVLFFSLSFVGSVWFV